MSNRAWMPLHIDDYIRDTDHLSATEHGAYLLLIMKYWRDGGLPADEGLIRRYAKLSVEQWAESRDVLAALFDDGWRHKRIDAELQKAAEIIEKRRTAGKNTQFKGKSSANAEQMPEHVPSKSTAPLTNNLSEKEAPNGASKKRATRLPADWVIPDDWLQEAIAAGMTRERALSEAERMKNWSLSSKNGVKLDWRAAWRNWFKDKLEAPSPRAASPPSDRDRMNATLDQIISGSRHDSDDSGNWRSIEGSFQRLAVPTRD
jgi:uncharacterized protein YdaU (DUF1376 family)